MVNLDDAGYWNSPEQCLAADEIRSLIGLLAKAHAECDELKETCISHAQIQNALLAERDAALDEVKTLSKNIGEFADRTTNEIRSLRSALREAKEALENGKIYQQDTGSHYDLFIRTQRAITMINKVLGEE